MYVFKVLPVPNTAELFLSYPDSVRQLAYSTNQELHVSRSRTPACRAYRINPEPTTYIRVSGTTRSLYRVEDIPSKLSPGRSDLAARLEQIRELLA